MKEAGESQTHPIIYDDSVIPYIIQAMLRIQQKTKIRVSIRDGNIRMGHIMLHYFHFEEPTGSADGGWEVPFKRGGDYRVKEYESTKQLNQILFQNVILHASTTEMRENSSTLEENMIDWLNLDFQDEVNTQNTNIIDM